MTRTKGEEHPAPLRDAEETTVIISHLTLANATEGEVLRRLPEALVFTFQATGKPGDIDVVLTDVDPRDAHQLATSRGFEVA
jgi:hypothetical protein